MTSSPAVSVVRCPWATASADKPSGALMQHYHDTQWGVPVHDERKHFEFLVLDAFQAGLSWAVVLAKREGFRRAFADFDPEKVARFNARSVERLVADSSIVRNRQKIVATIGNARAYLKVQKQEGSFDRWMWSFVKGRPVQNRWKTMAQVPARTALSDQVSKAMLARGFKFVGSTICYAYLQAAGLVNDHVISCFRHQELTGADR